MGELNGSTDYPPLDLIPAPWPLVCAFCEETEVAEGDPVAPVSEHCGGPTLFYACRYCVGR